ncbi:MAG TPA: RNA polymerase sigma factor [Ohtaekwangia sp.]|uniref:RNA polymerase sigma factor n=1 Tax=Ohtaekwangia sp. TaxID=2066019 RepID=UPI002F94617E
MKNFSHFSDEQLISYTLQNDNAALGELYNRYFKKVYQKCLSILKEEDIAFDVAQDSIMKAFDKLDTFKGDAQFSTWLYIIIHRDCLAYLRKKNKTNLVSLEENTGDDENESSSFALMPETDKNDQESIMFALIDHLPQEEKSLLLQKYQQGKSIEDLQADYHLTSSAVKMRLKRSKDKVNQLYWVALASGLSTALALM